jgi:DNA-directed RNA polymerase sigma subunit (sigma70/sigma32)
MSKLDRTCFSLTNRYALHSYDEIAAHFGISRVRVIQIERRALKKLRVGLEKRGVKNLREEILRDRADD